MSASAESAACAATSAEPVRDDAREPEATAATAAGASARQARLLLAEAQERGLSLAVAESLTGGGVCSALVAVPGASAVVAGGVVAYATRLKSQLLGVDEELLATRGPVDPEVARQMAEGVAATLGADLGLATTGVAGPGPADGHPAGTVHIAVASPWGSLARELHLSGERQEVREAATAAVLALAVGLLETTGRGGKGPALPDR